MQLQMTAPLDIGLEQQDMSLGGQDDIFDLGGAERGLMKKGGLNKLIGDDGDVMEDSDVMEVDESDDGWESDDGKIDGLEDELDGLYDAYQSRLRERDAKFKVKEARQNNAKREEWSGIQGGTDSNRENDSGNEGGWEKMQQAKVMVEESSDGESSEDEDSKPTATGTKRSYPPTSDPSHNSKRARLITKLETPKTTASVSKAAQVWFSQDVFAEIDDVDENDMLLDVPEPKIKRSIAVSP